MGCFLRIPQLRPTAAHPRIRAACTPQCRATTRCNHTAVTTLLQYTLLQNTRDAEYATFLGYATPPTSYGGYGGNAKEAPRYTFEYPAGWKEEIPSKVGEREASCGGRPCVYVYVRVCV